MARSAGNPDSASKRGCAVRVLLVHGAWTDGQIWSEVVLHLARRRVHCELVELPLSSLAADIAVVQDAIERSPRPALLVGHCWGGVVIGAVATHPTVGGLVYVNAFAPDDGESVQDIIQSRTVSPGWGAIASEEGSILKFPSDYFGSCLGHDLGAITIRRMRDCQKGFAAASFGEVIVRAGWRQRPCWYLVTEQNRFIDVNLQYKMAFRMKAVLMALPASHFSPLSQAEGVSVLILDAIENAAAKFRLSASWKARRAHLRIVES